ncbi:MAG: hypothetical protein RLY16_2020, partial [Bacteroidota bacterium]
TGSGIIDTCAKPPIVINAKAKNENIFFFILQTDWVLKIVIRA